MSTDNVSAAPLGSRIVANLVAAKKEVGETERATIIGPYAQVLASRLEAQWLKESAGGTNPFFTVSLERGFAPADGEAQMRTRVPAGASSPDSRVVRVGNMARTNWNSGVADVEGAERPAAEQAFMDLYRSYRSGNNAGRTHADVMADLVWALKDALETQEVPGDPAKRVPTGLVVDTIFYVKRDSTSSSGGADPDREGDLKLLVRAPAITAAREAGEI
jgi:hypothetical protein